MNPWFTTLAKSLDRLAQELTKLVAEERSRRSTYEVKNCTRERGHSGPCNGWPNHAD